MSRFGGTVLSLDVLADGDARTIIRSGEAGRRPQAGIQRRDTLSNSADIAVFRHEIEYDLDMQLRYNYRLDPTPGQVQALARLFGCVRVVFNDALRARRAAHQAGLPYITDGELSARLTASKKTPARAWLSDVSSVALQQSLVDLNGAYKSFFDSVNGNRKGAGTGLPRLKSRKDRRQSARFTANARFKVLTDGRLRLPGVGAVKVRWSRPLPSVPTSVTVIRDAAGRHFASFVIRTDLVADAARFPSADDEVGIDLGLTAFAVLSDGTVVTAPKFLGRAERKLKRIQRSHDRKVKGSKNEEKSRVTLARAHAKVANKRADFHHQVSSRIIRDNQAVYVEDLCVAGLAKTRLAKSIHDAGWSRFVRMLEYKAARYGRVFGKVGRFEPTSQVCSACGVKDGPKPLSVREWQCQACGAAHDRDLNAAKNVLALGRRESLNACGGDVRRGMAPAVADEAGTLRGAA